MAIVGARRASRYGRATAERLGRELAELDLTVVSGLARGVDAAAHAGALAAGGRTVAVLGSGLARLYPPEHVSLAADIAAGRGAVVSELPLDAAPLPHHFPRRNRVIAALAVAVVVVEAGEKSGALITADHALDLGRDVLAVPGRVDAEMSRGTHRLLREGAALCAGADDVLRALGLEIPDVAARGTSAAGKNDEERLLLAELRGEELDPDELMARTGLSAEVALQSLTAMELRGVVELMGDGRYCAG